MARKFLTDITIVGAMLVARCGDILRYTIPSLLKWCDWILIMFDNEDERTKRIVLSYQKKYPGRIRISYSGYPKANRRQEKNPRGLFHRFKPLQGPIRETIFKYMCMCVANGEKVDILIWPDSDEVFTNYLPILLEKFWLMPEKKAITMKPVDVYGDFKTLRGRSMIGHVRVLKYFPELTAIPYRTACDYRPLIRADKIRQNRVHIHLASLTQGKREWRKKHWKAVPVDEEPLWTMSKDVREMTPDEILYELKKKPSMTVKEYRKKYGLDG